MNNPNTKDVSILYEDLGRVLSWASRFFAISFGIGLAGTIVFFGSLSHPIDDIAVVIAIPITIELVLPYLLILIVPARPHNQSKIKELLKKYPSGWPGILLRSIFALIMVASASATLCIIFIVSSALYAVIGIDWAIRPSLGIAALSMGVAILFLLFSIGVGYFGSAMIRAGIGLSLAEAIIKQELEAPGILRFLRYRLP